LHRSCNKITQWLLIDRSFLDFWKRLLKLLFYGIKPIVVFDGRIIDLKRKEVLRRRDARLSQEVNFKK